MHIILSDGTKLNHIGATGEQRYLQGANRDTITFEFDEAYSVDALREVFTEANCETINIVTDDVVETVIENEDGTTETKTETVYTDNYHEGYVIRAEVAERIKEITPATGTTPAVTETRVFVTMAQRTYAETRLAAMQEEITNTQLALCEIYEGGLV